MGCDNSKEKAAKPESSPTAPNSKGPNSKASSPTSVKKKPEAPKHPYTFHTNEAQRDIFKELWRVDPIPELNEPRKMKQYEEGPVEDVLYPLLDNYQVIMVAGGFFGDEGKGKTVDAVAHHPNCTSIARTNSGENAGHTVYDSSGRKFVFNLAPSGLLVPGKKNYIGPECVMDPISFMDREVSQLIKAEIPYQDTLFVGNVVVVTPYHKLLDLLSSAPNSSTLKGMAPVHASKVTKRGIRLDHIFNDEEVMAARLQKDMETYFGLMKVKGLTDDDVAHRCEEENSDGVMRVPQYVVDFAKAEDKVGYLVQLYTERVKNNKQFPRRCDVTHELRAALERGEKILLEGPQSYWLSNAREKFWESTTSADTSAAGLLATSQFNFTRYSSLVINVHKTPGSSRVGIGANPAAYVPQDYFSAQKIRTLNDLAKDMCVDFDAIQKLWCNSVHKNGTCEPLEYEDETGTYNIGVAMAIGSSRHHGECGSVTLKPRCCGTFDCVAHYEVNAVQGPYLSISALDRGDDYDKIGITIAYIYYNKEGKTTSCNGRTYKNGDIIKAGDPLPSEAALYHCHPIIKMIDGWRDSPIAASKRKPGTPLPQGVCEVIATVEYFSKAKILSIGNGPNSENIIYIRQDDEIEGGSSLVPTPSFTHRKAKTQAQAERLSVSKRPSIASPPKLPQEPTEPASK